MPCCLTSLALGLLLWLKMFKYLSFHPKFHFLFLMFWRRILDIVMFAMVLAVFYLVFAISGFLLFNSDVAEFRKYSQSLISVNLFMIRGIDSDKVTASSHVFGWLFFFCWILIMGLVLVNVFIAILVESYAKTAEELAIEDDSGLSLYKKLKRGLEKCRHPCAVDEAIMRGPDDLQKELGIGLDRAWKLMEQFDDDGNLVLDEDEFEELRRHWESHKEHHKMLKRIALRNDNLSVQMTDARDLWRRFLRFSLRGRRAIIACKKREAKRKLAADEDGQH